MNFAIPTPQTTPVPSLPTASLILPDVPTYLDRNYFNIDTQITPANLDMPPILTSFYTILTKSIIVEKIDHVLSLFDNILSSLTAEYDYEIQKISRENSRNLINTSNMYGAISGPLISGLMVKQINDLHTNELLARQEISLKLKTKVTDEIWRKFNNFISSIDKANSLYADIFEKDFAITEKAFYELLDYLIASYNVYVSTVKATLEQQAINLQLFEEKLKNMVRNFEYIKEKYTFNDLSQEALELTNQFLQQEQEYLAELERYKFLQYEVLQLQNQIYSAELKKFATEIDKINKIASYIRERINIFLSRLEVAEAKQKLKDAQLDIVNSSISLEKSKLGAEAEKIDSLGSLYKAQYNLENNILEQQRMDKLDRFKLLVEKEIINKTSQWYDLLSNYLLDRDRLLDYVRQQASIRNNLYSIRSKVENKLSLENTKVREVASGNEQFVRITFPSVAEWFRTCAVTSANITASFIKAYS